MKRHLIILFGILFISFVSAVPTINNITIKPEQPIVSEDIVICANITDNVSEIITVRINLHSENPLWNWGLIMNKEGDYYCRSLSPQFMDSYDGKEISYYISARNLLNELAVSPTYYFTYLAAPFCEDGICNGDEDCSSCELDCGTCPEQEQSKSHTHTTVPLKQVCEPSWKCGDWSSCNYGRMARTCYDANYCKDSYNKPNEIAGCEINKKVLVGKDTNYLPIITFLGFLSISLLLVLLAVLIKK